MIDLGFQIENVNAPRDSASPLLSFALRIVDAEASTPIHSVALRCQARIEPTRRRYAPGEQEKLVDLFGEPPRWGQTLRGMLWAHTSAIVAPFIGSTTIFLPIPCTFDFNVAAMKYFHALEDGEVPLCFLFSGTVFYAGEEGGGLQIAQIPWEKEADYRLPVSVWKEMMDFYYPNSAWLNLRRDVFDRLYRFKSQQMLPTWEQALEKLLNQAEDVPHESIAGR